MNDNVSIASSLEALKLIKNIKEGEKFYLEDSQETYVCNNGELLQWTPDTSEGPSMTLYDYNKMIIQNLPSYDKKQLESAKDIFSEFRNKYDGQFYMLLGKEIGYYTLFSLETNAKEKMEDEILECLSTLGEVKSIDLTADSCAIEIWIVSEGLPTVLYFFNYDTGVVICH